jgi:hypothetical protein
VIFLQRQSPSGTALQAPYLSFEPGRQPPKGVIFKEPAGCGERSWRTIKIGSLTKGRTCVCCLCIFSFHVDCLQWCVCMPKAGRIRFLVLVSSLTGLIGHHQTLPTCPNIASLSSDLPTPPTSRLQKSLTLAHHFSNPERSLHQTSPTFDLVARLTAQKLPAVASATTLHAVSLSLDVLCSAPAGMRIDDALREVLVPTLEKQLRSAAQLALEHERGVVAHLFQPPRLLFPVTALFPHFGDEGEQALGKSVRNKLTNWDSKSVTLFYTCSEFQGSLIGDLN